MAIIAPTYQELFEAFSQELIDKNSGLTALEQGDKFMVLVNALLTLMVQLWTDLMEVQAQSIPATMTGDTLDLFWSAFGVTRNRGVQAIVPVVAVPRVLTNTASVTVGSTFQVGSTAFAARSGALLAGPYATFEVQASIVGAAFNLSAGTELVPASDDLLSKFRFLVGTGYNANGQLVGGGRDGADYEVDEAFSRRAFLYIASLVRGTYSAVYQALIGIPGIQSLALTENEPMVGHLLIEIDDGTANTEPSSNMLTTIANKLREWKAAGIGWRVYLFSKVLAPVSVRIRTAPGYNPNTVAALVSGQLSSALNAYTAGVSLEPSKIYDIAHNVEGVRGLDVLTPLEPVTVPAGRVFRPSSITVTVDDA